MTAAKEFAAPLAAQGKRLGVEGAQAGDDIVTSIQKLPKQISYEDAHELRSRLIAKREELNANPAANAPALGKIKKLIGILSGDLRQGLEQFDPRLATSLDAADTIYRDASKQFNNRLIRRLVKTGLDEQTGDPERIAKLIFQPGAIRKIERVKDAVDPATWGKLQQYAGHELLKKSESGGVLSGMALENTMTGRNGFGDTTLSAMFGDNPGLIQRWKDLATTLRTVQERPKGTPGGMLIQMKQGGAAIQLAAGVYGLTTSAYTGEFPTTAIGIMIAPIALAQMMTHKGTADLIIRGILTPIASPAAGALYGRLAAAALRPDMIDQRSVVKPAATLDRGPAVGLQRAFAN